MVEEEPLGGGCPELLAVAHFVDAVLPPDPSWQVRGGAVLCCTMCWGLHGGQLAGCAQLTALLFLTARHIVLLCAVTQDDLPSAVVQLLEQPPAGSSAGDREAAAEETTLQAFNSGR